MTGLKRTNLQRTAVEAVRASAKANLGEADGYKQLDQEELVQLVLKAKTCVKARNEVVFALFPYIQRQAYKMARTQGNNQIDTDDMFQAAYFGLAKAIEHYDPELKNEYGRSMSFTTYFTHWLKQSTMRELMNTQHSIRIPVHVMQMWRTILKNYKAYCSERGIVEQDIARLDAEFLVQFAVEPHKSVNSIKSLQQWLVRGHHVNSLDNAPSDFEDGEGSYHDIVTDGLNTEDEVLVSSSNSDMYHQIMLLPQRKRLIIFFRFGMGPFPEKTLDEVGQLLGLTRERIRQIESSALRLLKSRLARIKHLETYTNERICNGRNDVIPSDILVKLSPEQLKYLLTEDEALALMKTVDGFEPILNDTPEEGMKND